MGFYTVVIWYVQVSSCNPFIVIISRYNIYKINSDFGVLARHDFACHRDLRSLTRMDRSALRSYDPQNFEHLFRYLL